MFNTQQIAQQMRLKDAKLKIITMAQNGQWLRLNRVYNTLASGRGSDAYWLLFNPTETRVLVETIDELRLLY